MPFNWKVDKTERDAAHLISQSGSGPYYGGTPADLAVIEGVRALKAAGIGVTMSPFLMMDVPPGNGLSDPYGKYEQAPFPWRGRITVNADGTSSARQEIEAFIGQDGRYGFRHFILHHARLAKRAGGVDAFLIGSEMATLTRIRDQDGRFPFVEALIEIAQEVRDILGRATAISYAADWTEYGAYVPRDGQGDVLFPLDPLWASEVIDFIGVDWYPPTGDWRDGDAHVDGINGSAGPGDSEYLLANIEGGEGFDWYYASRADRDSQVRTPIRDSAHGEDWIFRQKDLLGWWSNAHHERSRGVRRGTPTAWQPRSKPLRLIEIGFPAVDKAPNAPNVFYDPKSSESAFPRYSNGQRDDLLQRKALAVTLPYWLGQPGVEQALVWAWDGRPWPDFPARDDVWSDGPNWQFGHWLNGRTGLIELRDVLGDLCAKANVTLQTRQLNGLIEGYSVDRVMSLASAIAPLSAAFDFHIREEDGGLLASSFATGIALQLDEAKVVEGSISETQTLLDKSPSGLSLSYISGDFSYQPAVTTHLPQARVGQFITHSSLPLVLSESQADIIAERVFDRLVATGTCSAAFGPGHAASLETGDTVRFKDRSWVIDRIEDQGLQRQLTLGATIGAQMSSAIVVPAAGERAVTPALSELFCIDGPALFEQANPSLLAAVVGDPWGGAVVIESGRDATQLQRRGVAVGPANMGRLLSDLAVGPETHWSRTEEIHIYVPNGALSSADPESVAAGTNRMLIQNEDGWELVAWQMAELVGPDEWRLTGLLRGLSGSPMRAVAEGALVVPVTDDLVPIAMPKEEVGIELHWRAGESVLQPFIFRDRAGMPWRVGHLKAEPRGDQIVVSWTDRGPDFTNNWGVEDPQISALFDVRTSLAGQETQLPLQSEASISLANGQADHIRVAKIGADQRRGEWVSIPLPSP